MHESRPGADITMRVRANSYQNLSFHFTRLAKVKEEVLACRGVLPKFKAKPKKVVEAEPETPVLAPAPTTSFFSNTFGAGSLFGSSKRTSAPINVNYFDSEQPIQTAPDPKEADNYMIEKYLFENLPTKEKTEPFLKTLLGFDTDSMVFKRLALHYRYRKLSQPERAHRYVGLDFEGLDLAGTDIIKILPGYEERYKERKPSWQCNCSNKE